jgi:hypothetical protein
MENYAKFMRFHVSLEEMVCNESMTTDNLSPRVRNLYELNKRKIIFYVRHERKEGEKVKGTSKTPDEQKISRFLIEKRVRFVYEPKYATIEGGGNIHIRYPDFYLPEFDLVIEYDGSKKDSARKRYAQKKRAYLGNDVNFLIIERWEMDSDVWKSKLGCFIEGQKSLKQMKEIDAESEAGCPRAVGCTGAALKLALFFGAMYAAYASCVPRTPVSAYSTKR